MKWVFCGFDPGTASIALLEVKRLYPFDHSVTPPQKKNKKRFSIADGLYLLSFRDTFHLEWLIPWNLEWLIPWNKCWGVLGTRRTYAITDGRTTNWSEVVALAERVALTCRGGNPWVGNRGRRPHCDGPRTTTKRCTAAVPSYSSWH